MGRVLLFFGIAGGSVTDLCQAQTLEGGKEEREKGRAIKSLPGQPVMTHTNKFTQKRTGVEVAGGVGR